MKENHSAKPGGTFSSLPLRFGLLTLLAGTGLALSMPANAAPPAGSLIGNQASATYTDNTGTSKTATSNLVETTVEQVGSLTLIDDNTKVAALGNTVYMPHVLTNTGNFTDSFTLSMVNNTPGASAFDFSGIAIYADTNNDGVPDSTAPLCTLVPAPATSCPAISLASGASYSFVTALTVPSVGPNAGDTDNITVTATAAGSSAIYGGVKTDSNTDTVTITDKAAFQVTKSISDTSGVASDTEELVYTLTYKNIGAAVGHLALKDVIGDAANNTDGFVYVAGKAEWSNKAGTILSEALPTTAVDATDGTSNVRYAVVTSGTMSTISATISSIGPNVTGKITFHVKVLSTAKLGTSTTTNTAKYGSVTDPTTDPTANTPTDSSNPSPYEVLGSYSLVLNDGTSATDGNNTLPANTDTDTPNNADLSYVATAVSGQSITFENTVWNKGSDSDTFNITYQALTTNATWPTGTTFQLLKSDGATQLLDTNQDNVVDTGPIPAGGSYTIVVKAILPSNAPAATGSFDVEVKATSAKDNTQSNVTYDRLGAITAPLLDLANSTISYNVAVNADAIGTGPTTTISPATTYKGPVAFDLFVANEAAAGAPSDTYTLQYSNTNFNSGEMPAGWSVQFRDLPAGKTTCTNPTDTNYAPYPGGTPIVSVTVAPQSQKHYCAIVTQPSTVVATTTEVYFRVVSAASGAMDTKWDRVVIGPNNKLEIVPPHEDTIYPGGTVVYPHNINNVGNSSCTDQYTFTVSAPTAGWTYTLYWDVNKDSKIDAGDTPLSLTAANTIAALNPGEQFKILVKVFAPGGAVAGDVDTASISATGTCGAGAGVSTQTNTTTDRTTVVTGSVRLYKTQAINPGCTTTSPADAAFVTTELTAKPGECIWYKVVATNEGLTQITDLVVKDTMPPFTGYDTGPTCSSGANSTMPVSPTKWSATANGTQSVTDICTVGTLAPGASTTMKMSVQVNKF